MYTFEARDSRGNLVLMETMTLEIFADFTTILILQRIRCVVIGGGFDGISARTKKGRVRSDCYTIAEMDS